MPHALAPGSEVAGYTIDSLLGEGGTGAVYLARDAEGRAVALKVLDPAVGADSRFRERFLRESGVAAVLEHPNVVPVLDAGEDGGLLYIAMEWVDGTDLRELLRRDGALEPERAVALVEDVAAGLDVAHAAGLVHRDVKPGNILVAADRARLCDFGLAKHTASADSLTGERMLVGTVAYIAPEQIEGTGVDARSDVYSLGCVLYECLTGEPPFDRDSELAVLYAHLNEPPPRPSTLRAELPAALDDVVAVALAKDPAERPASGGELARAARAALHGRSPLRRRRAPVVLAAAGALAAVTVAAVLVGGGGGDGAPARPQLRLGSDVLAAVDASSGRLVSRVRLPGRPDELTSDGRSTWVVLDDRRRVARVDVRTRTIAASARLPFGAGGIAAGEGGLWVAEAFGPRVALVGDGGVQRTFRLPRGAEHAGPLAVGSGSLWLGRGPEVLRVDPASGRVRARVSTPVEVTVVRAAGDAVWAVSGQEGRIAKIDPATDSVVARNRIHGWAADLAVGGGFAWLAVVPDDVIFKLSADDLAVAGTTRASPGPDVLAWDGARLWASTGVGRSLLRIGGESATPPPLRMDAIPVGVAANRGLLWTATLPLPAPAQPAGKGGELRVAMAAGGLDADPATSLSPDLAQLRYTTCAGLLAYPDAAGAAGRRLVPEVAAAPPAISADRRTYTFRIRPGYRFSPPSGAAVTAETFRATLERTLSPRLGETAIAMSLIGDIVGAEEYHAGRARHVRGLAADGDRLTIRLEQPAGDLPARLALPLFCPVPRGTPAIPGGSSKLLPSPGPYYVASQEPGRTVLERNPNYRGSRPRRPDRIVYLTGVGPDEALRRADRGEVDYVPYDYDSHGPLAVGGERDRAFGATSAAARRGDPRYFASPAPGLDMLALNPSRPLFRDVEMRRAVNEALDRPALAAVWGEVPTDRYVPPSILAPGGAPRYPLSAPDVAAARRLAAGRRGSATLYYCGDPGNQRVAEIVRANLRPIGIRVRIAPSLGCLRGHDPKRDVADIALLSPGSLALDAVGFLQLAGGDDGKFGGNMLPRSWWHDDAFLRRVARADALAGAERDAAFAALQEEALEKDVTLASFSTFVRPEYVAPRIGCRVRQGAYQFLDFGAACVRKA
jgi:ABC-type transport system substrate-binding protein